MKCKRNSSIVLQRNIWIRYFAQDPHRRIYKFLLSFVFLAATSLYLAIQIALQVFRALIVTFKNFHFLNISFAISPFSRLTLSRCPSGARCSLVPIWPQPYSHQPTSNRYAYRIYFHTYLIKQILMYPPIYLLSTHTHLPQTGAFDTAYTLIPVVDSSTYSFRSSTPCCCFMLSFGTPKMKDLACSSWWILCPLRPKNLSVSDWKKEILGKGIWEGQNVVNGEVLATKKNLEEFNKGVKES